MKSVVATIRPRMPFINKDTHSPRGNALDIPCVSRLRRCCSQYLLYGVYSMTWLKLKLLIKLKYTKSGRKWPKRNISYKIYSDIKLAVQRWK